METTTPLRKAYRPDVLLLHRFLERSGANLPRRAVRDALATTAEKNPISLLDIYNALKYLGITPGALKTDLAGISRIKTPFITSRPKGEGEYFIVVENVCEHTVAYYSPASGLLEETLPSFGAHWKGVLLTAGEGAADNNPLSPTDEEQEAARRYLAEHIRLHDDFLPEATCDYLIRYAEERALFDRSTIKNATGSFVSTGRTSFSAFLRDRDDPVLKEIYQKAAVLLQLPEECIEDLQIVRYAEGQEFRAHFDATTANNRVHTLLVYLNDSFTGGETYFQEVDFKVRPRKGRMLYFLNRDEENRVILFSSHAGLSVQGGIKYGCNIWASRAGAAKHLPVNAPTP